MFRNLSPSTMKTGNLLTNDDGNDVWPDLTISWSWRRGVQVQSEGDLYVKLA